MAKTVNMPIILSDCSDEEEYDKAGISYGHAWGPRPEEAVDLYQKITQNKLIEFQWKCPGRRNPDEDIKPKIEPEEQVAPKETESGANDFDFEEESTPFMRRLPGKAALLKGGAKKKTTSLAGILSNMERHRIMDKMETGPGDKTSKPAK